MIRMIATQTVPTEQLRDAPYNPRKPLRPGDPAYIALSQSLTEFGLVEPIVWNTRTGHVVGGHQRLAVLRADGAPEVHVTVVDLSLEQEKALNLALNKIQGEWDHHKLAAILDELLRQPDFDLGVTGFDMPEVRDLIDEFLPESSPNDNDFDVAAELAAITTPVTQAGDLILLGTEPATQHRLLCGDCTDADSVQRLMEGERAVLMATDPPYCVGYDGTNHPSTRGKDGHRKNKDWSGTYGKTWDDALPNKALYDGFIRCALEHAVTANAGFYIWHASRHQAMLEDVLNTHGIRVHAQIIWAKNRPVLTRTWYSWQHEPCLFGWKPGFKPARVEKAVLSTVWNFDTIPNGVERPDHPTPKPLELFEIPIRQHTAPNEICYEPFAGSGTQILAAHRMGRRCFAVEISPQYCDLIVRRFIAKEGPAGVLPEVAEKYAVHPVSPDAGGAT